MSQDVNPVRRQFMQSLFALPWVVALTSLQSRMAFAATSPLIDSPYGGLAAVNDLSTGLPLLKLPAGFSYKSFSWTGDELAGGATCPGSHDGMGIMRNPKRPKDIWIARNHEVGNTSTAAFFGATHIYDSGKTSGEFSGGGTVHLLFRDGNWVKAEPGIAGTHTNCAGGQTPWGTWLTCEEIARNNPSATGKKHGYVFEVGYKAKASNAQPIVGMGRFKHEAAAVDPASSNVFMTEDNSGRAGIYRYVPTVKTGAEGSLAQGGVLQMAKVVGQNNVDISDPQVGDSYALEWVNIANPDQDTGTARAVGGATIDECSGPFVQAYALGALRMNRGEGIAYHDGKIFIMDTSGGAVDKGAIWALDLATQKLTCFYVSAGSLFGDKGDNIVVSPRGGLLMCEDPSSVPTDEFGKGSRLMGINPAGEIHIFAKNNVNLSKGQLRAAGKSTSLSGDRREGEFTGACFDPSGTWLFCSIQDPGITFAITGPWAKGSL